jgi:hypothetical protein
VLAIRWSHDEIKRICASMLQCMAKHAFSARVVDAKRNARRRLDSRERPARPPRRGPYTNGHAALDARVQEFMAVERLKFVSVMPLWQLPSGMQRYERCARWKRIAFRLIHWMPSSVRQISSARQLRNETGAFLNEFPFCHAELAAFMMFQKLLFAEPHVARRLRGWFVSGASGFATTATMTCLL